MSEVKTKKRDQQKRRTWYKCPKCGTMTRHYYQEGLRVFCSMSCFLTS